MADAQVVSDVPVPELRQEGFDLVCRAGHHCDRGEVLTGQVGELLDQLHQSGSGRRFDELLGFGHSCSISRLEIGSPVVLVELIALGDRLREHHRHSAGSGHGQLHDPRQAGQQRRTRHRQEVQRVEVPAIDHDVERWTRQLADLVAVDLVETPLHGGQQPGLEEGRHRFGDPLAEPEAPVEHPGSLGRPARRGREAGDWAGLDDPDLPAVPRPLDILG